MFRILFGFTAIMLFVGIVNAGVSFDINIIDDAQFLPEPISLTPLNDPLNPPIIDPINFGPPISPPDYQYWFVFEGINQEFTLPTHIYPSVTPEIDVPRSYLDNGLIIHVVDENWNHLDSVILWGYPNIPEPASIALLGIGGLMMMRRPRKSGS